jgi:5-methylcytosine-specific restriction endonuclease McrA
MKGWAGKGSTRQWRKLRSHVLRRDGYVCRLRHPGCTHVADQVHHIAGKVMGDNPALLVAACHSCNRVVGNPETSGFDPQPKPLTHW